MSVVLSVLDQKMYPYYLKITLGAVTLSSKLVSYSLSMKQPHEVLLDHLFMYANIYHAGHRNNICEFGFRVEFCFTQYS